MSETDSTNKQADNQTEVWKDVVGYEGYYMVSDLGRVKSLARVVLMSDGRSYHVRTKLLKLMKYSGGYFMVHLFGGEKAARNSVHRLVLEAHVGLCPEGMQCRHLDGDKENNHLSNLVWGTASEDREDQRRLGTMYRGEKHHLSKLTEEDIREIRMLRNTRGYTLQDLAARFSVDWTNIRRIVRGGS